MSRRRAKDPDLHGVLLLDKPAGPTSHDVVGWVRWVLGVRRVGHCGTLDPAATGLLVIGVGAATKLAPYLTGQDKGYRARFVLGASTTTADAQGEVTEQAVCPQDLPSRIPGALRDLLGEHALPPPAYSAVHVDGRRAHELAREGLAPVLPPRPMQVQRVEPGAVRIVGERVEVDATLRVSKGTYIRSLAAALGQRLGVPAHLGALHRTASGALSLEHPRAVSGLSAEPREPAPNGAPRWQLLGPMSSEGRDALAQWMRAQLLAPADAVPMPLWRVTDDDSGRRALVRLTSGQPVSRTDPGFGGADADEPLLAVAPADAQAAGLIIARVQGHGEQVQLHPQRVVVPPTPDP